MLCLCWVCDWVFMRFWQVQRYLLISEGGSVQGKACETRWDHTHPHSLTPYVKVQVPLCKHQNRLPRHFLWSSHLQSSLLFFILLKLSHQQGYGWKSLLKFTKGAWGNMIFVFSSSKPKYKLTYGTWGIRFTYTGLLSQPCLADSEKYFVWTPAPGTEKSSH